MYIAVFQTFNIQTILVFPKYFTSFLYRTQVTKWFTSNHANFDIVDNKRKIKFSKDDMINFLVTRYNYYQKHLRGTENKPWYKVDEIIREIEENEKFRFEYQSNGPLSSLFRFLPRPGEIDLEIAQLNM